MQNYYIEYKAFAADHQYMIKAKSEQEAKDKFLKISEDFYRNNLFSRLFGNKEKSIVTVTKITEL